MLDVFLVVVGVLGIAVAGLSEHIQRLPLSEPLLGLIAGVLTGPALLGWIDLPTFVEDPAAIGEASRALLAVSVMAVALRFPLGQVRSVARPVALLILVGLPAMALLTAGVTTAVLGVGIVAALLVGAATCPTDPVLASSTVTGAPAERTLPAYDRRVLSIESGANDGLALPLVLLAVAASGAVTAGAAALESVVQVLGAVALGIVTGYLGGRALKRGRAYGASAPRPRLLFTILLALAVLGLSGVVGVDGVLAVFVAGLAFNGAATGRDRSDSGQLDETINRFVVLPLFVVLGVTLPWQEWRSLDWRAPVLVLAVLLLRRLPVLLSLKRPLHLGLRDAVYLGWFGPIGVSALLYLALEADRIGIEPDVLAAGSLLVAGSTVVHGLTSSLGLALYHRASQRPAAAVRFRDRRQEAGT